MGNAKPMNNISDFYEEIKKKGLNIPLPPKNDIIEANKNVYGGASMNDYIKRDEFENFKNHLDNKFDRLMDKIDENRRELKDDMKHQTTITISVIGAITAIIGILVPVILHFI